MLIPAGALVSSCRPSSLTNPSRGDKFDDLGVWQRTQLQAHCLAHYDSFNPEPEEVAAARQPLQRKALTATSGGDGVRGSSSLH
jgi:hypothetical protein